MGENTFKNRDQKEAPGICTYIYIYITYILDDNKEFHI